ncbi:MAG: hypothetical protein JNL88_05715 [Bacteroidia bacterium]|nr:hypothetical protein [Bacteroidia bacterium]
MRNARSFDPGEWTAWLREHADDDPSALALKYAGKKEVPLPYLLRQVKGRQVARHKLPSWYREEALLYPDTLILEQCSSEATALLKAGLASGKKVADLSGGLGVDTWAFAQKAREVLYCEPDAERCKAALHNFEVLGLKNVTVSCTDAETILQQGLPGDTDLIYLDPSRRNAGGKKVYRLEDLQPEVLRLKASLLQQAEEVLIKLSPMLDIREGLRQLPETRRVDVVAWKGECRELLFQLSKKTQQLHISCIEAESESTGFEFSPEEEAQLPLKIAEPSTWLYEAHAAVRKAGPWKSLCKKPGVSMLHPNTHLFTSHELLSDFPGRAFRIEKVLPFKKEKILDALQGHPAQLVFYNFPATAKKVQQELKIPSGEPRYLFFVTLEDGGPAVLLAVRR